MHDKVRACGEGIEGIENNPNRHQASIQGAGIQAGIQVMSLNFRA